MPKKQKKNFRCANTVDLFSGINGKEKDELATEGKQTTNKAMEKKAK